MATGEVLLNGTQLGTVGNYQTFTLSNLFDGNNQTAWSTFGVAATPWAGIDASVPCTLTKLRLSANGGHEDLVIGAQLQASTDPTFPGPVLVQTNYNAKLSSGSISCPFNSNNASGNLIVVFLESDGTGISISDTAGNTSNYVLTASVAPLYAYVAPNIASGANTITAAITGGTFASLIIVEYSGVATSNPVDSFGTTSGTGISGSVSCTTMNDTDVLVAGWATAGSVDRLVAGPGFTIQASYNIGHQAGASNEDTCAMADASVVNQGTHSATAFWSTSGSFEAIIIALKAPTAPTVLFTIPGAGTPSSGVVQANYNAKLSAGGLSCSFNADNTAGDLIIAIIETDGTGVSISDVTGNAYSLVTMIPSVIYAYAAPNILVGTNVVTATITGGTFVSIMIVEYAGLVTTNPVDSFGTSSGSGTSGSVSCVTNNPNDILVSVWQAPGTGTLSSNTPGYAVQSAYSIGHTTGSSNTNGAVLINPNITSAGTQTSTASWVTSGPFNAILFGLQAVNTNVVPTNPLMGRANTGTLMNEYPVSQSSPFRYYRYLSSVNSNGNISDLDFIAHYTSGLSAQCCTPTIAPPGGDYDKPIVVRFSCITTDAQFYYTVNGVTPTTSSTLYTGPFVISSNCTLKVIGTSAGLSNSRVASCLFHVPSSFISTDQMRDSRMYTVGFASMDPHYFLDPIGGYWWLYGFNGDEIGVFSSGSIGNNIYYSSDLRNWTYSGVMGGPPPNNATGFLNTAYNIRPHVLYNALNNNYVMWTVSLTGVQVYTAPAPSGPWVLFNVYTILNGISCIGDSYLFTDPANGSVYKIWDSLSSTQLVISRLTPDYLNVDGVNFVVYPNNNSSPFGQPGEGHTMFYNNGHYFWLTSNQKNWTPTLNLCVSNTGGPLASWGSPFNPFVNISVSPTAAESAVSVTPAFTNAYDGQNCSMIQIPGRSGSFIWVGDRYLTGLTPSQGSSTTATFWNYNRLTIPVTFPSPGVVSIQWNNNWTLDGTFPTTSGAPAAVTNMVVSTVATWTNNETNPCTLYLDNSNDPTFATGVTSELLPEGSTSFIINPSVQHASFFTVRAVNANGSTLAFFPPPPPPPSPPPTMPGSGQHAINPFYDNLLRTVLRVKAADALTYPEQTLTEPHSLTHGISPANDIPPEFQNEYVKLYFLAEYTYRI